MAESDSGGSKPASPKEMTMEVRLLLAFLLMGVVMFVSQYLFPTAPPPKPAQKQTAATTDTTAPNAPATPVPAQSASEPSAATAPTTAATPSKTEPPLIIETDVYKVVLSNQGGNVRSW